MSDSSSKIESILENITFSPGVQGVVVCDRDGIPIRDSFQDVDRSRAIALAEAASELIRGAQQVCALSGSAVDCLRIRSTSQEILVKSNGKYLLVVIQEPSE
jgi:predicted regulator of Ras-like GTPase activity (Roadblock/LC7/MglB family)